MMYRYIARQIVLTLFMLAVTTVPVRAAESVSSAAQENEKRMLSLGEKMYRDGLLSSGAPLRGYVKGDVEIDSTAFSCSNCHTYSGLGSVEGQVSSPPVNGATLFNPRFQLKDQVKNSISKSRGVKRPAQALRPAYTEQTLADALRGGVDPTGRVLAPVMPRYNLNDQDMRILVNYLKNLSATFSPGVTDTSLSFATIVTDDVSAEDRQAMLASLETLVTINRNTKTQRKLPQFAKMFRMLDNAFYRDISIKTWELHGDPSTWRTQLEAYNRKEPVFAILGGISNKPWQPIHDFCEDNKIPCLFPITDLPVISTSSWYTYYASKGFYQEGETAARHILQNGTGSKTLQIVRTSPQGAALSAGFTAVWSDAGQQLQTVTVPSDQKLDADNLQQLLAQHTPDSVVIWAGEEIIPVLNAIPGRVLPSKIYISSRFAGKTFTTLTQGLRDKVFITYPFRLPQDDAAFEGYKDLLTLGKLKTPDEKRIATRTYAMIHIFLQGLRELKLNYYRDTLLDVIAMRPDEYLPDFERYSFGPGQRYASKGCYIVQLDSSSAPQLVKASEWVLH